MEFQGTSRFEVIRLIGSGGMGSVYEAVDRLAKEEGVSLSTIVRDLVKEAIEIREDIDLGRIAESREKSLKRSRALAHKDIWG